MHHPPCRDQIFCFPRWSTAQSAAVAYTPAGLLGVLIRLARTHPLRHLHSPLMRSKISGNLLLISAISPTLVEMLQPGVKFYPLEKKAHAEIEGGELALWR